MRKPPSLWIDRPDEWPDDPPRDEPDTRVMDAETPEQPGHALRERVRERERERAQARGATEAPPRAEPGPQEPARERTQPPARRGRRIAVALVAALVLAGGGGYLLGTSGEDDAAGGGGTATSAASEGEALPMEESTVPASPARELYAAASEAVVSIQVRSGQGVGSGTGFLIDENGTIVTNAHVVSDAERAQVRLDEDERPISGEVVGKDVSTDLAVVKVPETAVEGIDPLELADSSKVRVGDAALAIGYPLGLERTATAGIVSGLEREIQAPNGFSIDEVIQTDAPINPGNSGGPLLDSAGRVIGVNSQIATAGGGSGNVGIGFAVPSATVAEVVPRLIAGETIDRAWLGVSTTDASGPAGGAAVATVVGGGPASRAGLRPGDVIVGVDGSPVRSSSEIGAKIEAQAPGDEVEIQLQGGRTVEVVLGNRPESVP